MSEETSMFVIEKKENEEIRHIINEVYNSLEERGYNATNQIVGYLISGDPGYISSYQSAREKILTLDRTGIIEVLLTNFIQNNK